MRLFLPALAVLLAISGCGRHDAVTASPQPSPTPSPRKRPVKPSADLVASMVRLRVEIPRTDAKTYTGALIHRDELTASGTYFDRNRCVLSLLAGCSAEQLRDKATKFTVFRNLTDAEGETYSHPYVATLVEFDERTCLAKFTYEQGFTSDLDSGFRISSESPDESTVALRFIASGNQSAAIPQSKPSQNTGNSGSAPADVFPAMALASGSWSGETAHFSGNDHAAILGESPLLAKAPARLVGFVAHSDDASVKPVIAQPITTVFRPPILSPTSVSFRARESSVTAEVHFDATRVATRNGTVYVNFVPLQEPDNGDLATLQEPYEPISASKGQMVPGATRAQQCDTHLPLSSQEGDVRAYKLQLAWYLPDPDTSMVYSRPFIIRLTRTDGGVTALTDGIANLSEGSGQQVPPATTFEVESPIVAAYEIAEGREVLLELNGEPYWKRFSMEKNTWLPLPAANLASAGIAGNRSSLFVLDRTGGEFRKYRATDLALEASTRLGSLAEHYYFTRAGCNSNDMPVYVGTDRGIYSLDAKTLLPDDHPGQMFAPPFSRQRDWWQGNYMVTGDGRSVIHGTEYRVSTYQDEYAGLKLGYFGCDGVERNNRSVSGAFAEVDNDCKTCANPGGKWLSLPCSPPQKPPLQRERTFMFPNAPVIARATPSDMESVPAIPGRLRLYGFFDTEPFAETDAPDFAGVQGTYDRFLTQPWYRICFDPVSRRIGYPSRDQKSWRVRDLACKEDRCKPVLLNWPDNALERGEEFHFTPHVFGECHITGEVVGTQEPSPVTYGDDGISFRLGQTDATGILMLRLTVAGRNGAATYPILIVPKGPAAMLACESSRNVESPADLCNGLKSLTASKEAVSLLHTSYYRSPDRIVDYFGPTGGFLALLTEAKRLDILSMETKKVVHSIPAVEKGTYYAGCGTLLEYDAKARKLTRINLPDCERGPELALPADVELQGIGTGSRPHDPLSLLLERRSDQVTGRIGDYDVKMWHSNQMLMVVDSRTFKPGAWMQPQIWHKAGDTGESRLQFMPPSIFPCPLLGSKDGSILALPNHLAVIGSRYSILAPFPGESKQGNVYREIDTYGSITGIVTSCKRGIICRNGIEDTAHLGSYEITPCGRYGLYQGKSSLDVITAEGSTQLFRISHAVIDEADQSNNQAPGRLFARSNFMLGESGPIMDRSQGGHLLEFVELNIPKLAKELIPGDFHVISQPVPYALEGTEYEYQVQVTTPDMVAGYTLRAPANHAAISPTGLLKLTPPASINAPEILNVEIEITGKAGHIVRHAFPLLVIPKTPPLPPDPSEKAGSKNTPPAKGAV